MKIVLAFYLFLLAFGLTLAYGARLNNWFFFGEWNHRIYGFESVTDDRQPLPFKFTANFQSKTK